MRSEICLDVEGLLGNVAPSEASLFPVRLANSMNSDTVRGPVPGAHCCETVGFYDILSARRAGDVETLTRVFSEAPSAAAEDCWHRLFQLDDAQEPHAFFPVFTGCSRETARALASLAPEGYVADQGESRHVAYARNHRTGELASVMDVALKVASTRHPERLSGNADVPLAVDVVLSLNFIYTRCSERRKGAAAALTEFAGYIFHREIEAVISHFCPEAEKLGEDLAIRVSLDPALGSQGGFMMRGLLAETLDANICMMTTGFERWSHDNFTIAGDFGAR
ncbi:hypothetical protein [Burkholderia cenocepacia]|uniref:hypothetical protein n=1 Tax=Burkholderia cenocepacia TaxID=95486 RepID=UPI0007615A90|nr:hypothetical protein [Burkholderia cenocepacia]KWU17904.1 hypothetical protein AS149_14610 [Burkholderia cenocepacia]